MNAHASIDLFDRALIHAHVSMVHERAAGLDGVLVLAVYGEDPYTGREEKFPVERFSIGHVEPMVGSIMAYEGRRHANVYIGLHVMRRDLARRARGTTEDIVAVLGLVADMDADTGKNKGEMPVAPSYIVESSPGNYQPAILFDRPLSVSEAKPLAQALRDATGSDSGTADVNHIWRVPGTLNWPNKVKVDRGRSLIPAQVGLLSEFAGVVYSADALRAALAPWLQADKNSASSSGTDSGSSGSEFSEALLPGELRILVCEGVQQGLRSRMFNYAVNWLRRLGWTPDAIERLLSRHPNGIAAKYQGRVRREIDRVFDKAAERESARDRERTEPLFDPWEGYPVPGFPLDVLPPVVGAFVSGQAELIGCDVSAMAMTSLAAISAALDHRFCLRMMRNGSWCESPRLWVLLVGKPSEKKTPTMRAATAELVRTEARLQREYKIALAEHKAAKGEDQDAPKKPLRYVVHDVTIEKMAEILSLQDRGVLELRDEIAGWIGGMEKYSGGSGLADRAFWLQTYNGGAYSVDRVKGERHIDNLSISLIGGIQPERLAELKKTTATDGLLQRFLPVMMQPARFRVDKPSDGEEAFARLIRRLINAAPAGIILDDAGVDAMEELHKELFRIEKVSDAFGSGLQAFLGKLQGVAGSLALILHMSAAPQIGATLKVGADTVGKVSRVVLDFIVPHAFEFYRTAENVTDGDRLRKLASYILTAGKDRFVPSDFTTNVAHLRGLGTEDLAKRVAPMVACDWLTTDGHVYHPKAWHLQPQVRLQFAERIKEEERQKAALAKLMNSPRHKHREEV